MVQRYVWVKDFIIDKNVVDIGCGYGYGTKYLSQYAREIIGIDSYSKAIRYAKKRYSGIQFRTEDITSLESLANSDYAISFGVIEHLKENLVSSFLNSVRNLLKKEGKIVFSTPNKIFKDLIISKNPYHEKECYPNEMLDLLINILS